MHVVINADDFGLSEAVNEAIRQSFEQGWISSASVMANMPSFESAVDLTHRYRLVGKVGVHLNLTQGGSLTTDIRSQQRLCSQSGELCARPRDLFLISSAEQSAIQTEFRAQILACRRLGIEPSHLDSHHHVHTSWSVGRVTVALAIENGIPFVRLAHNTGSGVSRAHKLYSLLFNRQLRRRDLGGVKRFCALPYATKKMLSTPGGIELMAHPVIDASGEIVDSVYGNPLGPLVRGLLSGRSCVSYGDLALRARDRK